MDFKIALHRDTPPELWDEWVKQIGDATYHHAWHWIRYCELFSENLLPSSFAFLENERKAVAVCPLAVTLGQSSGRRELSINGIPPGAPVIASVKPSVRRQILDAVFSRIRELAIEHRVSRIRMQSHPLTQGFAAGAAYCAQNGFELQKFQLIADVRNTLVIDLGLSVEALEERLSKYHRRNIKKGQQKGIRVQAFSGSQPGEELKKYFGLFQHAHFVSAGRQTRPQATWDLMLEVAAKGSATLFVAFIGTDPISFLFCGEFGKMSFGWSQVNLEEYEAEYSPRHVLEWEAILHYKGRDLRFYEVGDRFMEPQWTHQPSAKELSISQFKEKYGGIMMPKVEWVGYLDPLQLEEEMLNYLKALKDKPLMLGSATGDAG